MKVKFKNTEVDIWKLRKGAVVLESIGQKHYYIEGFMTMQQDTPILVLQDCGREGSWMYISTGFLEWLEPH